MKKLLPFLLLIAAISISAVAAFYSVYGLAKLFAGHFKAVLIMAGVLEAAKLIVATGLHWKHKVWPKMLTGYMTAAVLGLMIITSSGIYGFLSDGYTQTSNQDKILTRKIELIETKQQIYVDQKTEYQIEKEALIKSISELREGLSNPGQIQYIDKNTGEKITTTSSSARKSLESQLNDAIQNRDEITNKIQIATDSIGKYEIEKVEMMNNSDVASELGPLKYIAGLVNKPMDTVVNWLMLLIVFVFDPLAIALVLAANAAFEELSNSNQEPENGEQDEDPSNVNESPVLQQSPEDVNTEVMDMLDELDDHIRTQTVNRELDNIAKSDNKQTLTANQIRNMSHEAIQKMLQKS